MKVISGRFRGRKLVVGDGVRPTSGKCKEALFSRWGDQVQDARFLDLFAGSGGVGIEALSRGAKAVLSVELDRRAARTIERNLGLLGLERGGLARADVLELPAAVMERGPFDLVFADPPYAFRQWQELLGVVAMLLAPGGEASIEHSTRVTLPESCCLPESLDSAELTLRESRAYGESALSFFERVQPLSS